MSQLSPPSVSILTPMTLNSTPSVLLLMAQRWPLNFCAVSMMNSTSQQRPAGYRRCSCLNRRHCQRPRRNARHDTRLSSQQHVEASYRLRMVASTNWDSYDQSDVQFQTTPCALLYMPSSQVASTTVTLSCMASLWRSLVGYRQYCTLLLDWSPVFAEISISPRHCVTR